jgi:hypothetical protein
MATPIFLLVAGVFAAATVARNTCSATIVHIPNAPYDAPVEAKLARIRQQQQLCRSQRFGLAEDLALPQRHALGLVVF